MTEPRAPTPPSELPSSPADDEVVIDHLELLAVMGRDFAASLDIDATLARALALITRYIHAEGGALFMLDESGEYLTCTSCYGGADITGIRLKSDQGIVGRSVQDNVGEIVRDVSKDPRFYKQVDEESGFTTKSILCAPMSVHDQKIGAIELVNKAGDDPLFNPQDLHLLETMSSSAALAIINARMAEQLMEQERVRRELELAAEIQRSLLPVPRDEGFPVHGINQPARLVSGDFYDFFTLPDGRICFNLGDVSGKGMNAALLMAKTASLYRCLGKTVHDPGALLAMVNAEICETATRGMFVTMVGGIYEPQTGLVRLANAGHEPPLVHRADGSFTALPAESPPLGIAPLSEAFGGFPEIELRLDGGTLYVFTDGVTEGFLEGGTTLEVSGLKALIRDHADLSASARLDAVIAPFNHDGGLRDDVTVLAIDDGGQVEVRQAARVAEQPMRPSDWGTELVKLRLPAKPDRLKLVRSTVSEVATLCGCSEAVVRDLVLAVDEACQNIIRHAYGDDAAGDIILEIRRQDDCLLIFLRDFADTVDVTKVRPRDLDDLRPGGLGTYLMSQCMDEVEFMPPPEDGGNLLRMVKKIE